MPYGYLNVLMNLDPVITDFLYLSDYVARKLNLSDLSLSSKFSDFKWFIRLVSSCSFSLRASIWFSYSLSFFSISKPRDWSLLGVTRTSPSLCFFYRSVIRFISIVCFISPSCTFLMLSLSPLIILNSRSHTFLSRTSLRRISSSNLILISNSLCSSK